MNTKRLKLLSLCAATTLIASCSNGAGPTNKEPILRSAFWSCSASEKIVKDRAKEYYSSYIREETALKINACRGEYEMDQIIVTPNRDVDMYYATVSTLKTKNGFTIPKANVNIFGAKYLKVSNIYDSITGEEPGYFPDALVPIEALRNFNDLKIQEGHNQSIYLVVEVPYSQKPGLYEGEFTVDLDGDVHTFPVSVNVNELQVNEETHSKSIFQSDWMFESGELNATEEMMEKYTETLHKYRLSSHTIQLQSTYSDEEIHRYTERAFNDMQSPKCTNVTIPVKSKNIDHYIQQTFDEEVMEKFITSYYVKSMSENFNMFDKSIVWMGGLIDEPDDRASGEPWIIERTQYICTRFKALITEIADTLDKVNVNHPMHNELIASIRNLKNLVTSAYLEQFDGYIDTYCPKVNYYHTEETRSLYDFQEEKWWYTCVFPKAPYPTYHTEDRLSSARLLSWMQANYDVVGNLFWATNVYAQQTGGIYHPIDDYYEGDACRYAGVNGDGYLFFPAKQYELDEPAGSLRLYAIRDGLEEYEILYNLKEEMKKLGLDDEGFFSFLTEFLYKGTIVNATSIELEKGRETLLNLALANENGSNFAITDYEYDIEDNKIDLSFYANNETVIKVNDVEIQPSSSYKNGHIYNSVINFDDAKDINELKIEVSYKGKTNIITQSYGKSNTVYGSDELSSSFKKYNSNVAVEKTSYEEYDDVLKLTVSGVKEKKQSIKFIPPFLDEIDYETSRMTFNVINPYNEELKFSIGHRYESKKYDSYLIENTILKPGINTIEINLGYYKWSSVGKYEYLMFVLGDTTSEEEAEKTIYLKNVIITSKQGGM